MNDDRLYARTSPDEVFARLHYYSLTLPHGEREIEYVITVHEYGPGDEWGSQPQQESRRFVARADKQTNQDTLPYTPTGWGSTLVEALSHCVREIHRFPYEGDEDRIKGAMDIDESQFPED